MATAAAVDSGRGPAPAPAEVGRAAGGSAPGWTVLAGGLTLGVALGGSGRLSYHEAIAAQSARELLARGAWLVPTLGGRPWLEKPPLATWAIVALGHLTGRIDPWAARLPGALAALALALVVAALAGRRYGPAIGRLAGVVQVTAAWLVTRGRLAEPDVPLAAVVAAALLALDRLRVEGAVTPAGRRARWAFFGLLGATALLKGVGFGAVLTLATAAALIAWDRDRRLVRALAWPAGWLLAAGIALAWPLRVLATHPEALGLWAGHVTDRLAAQPTRFAGESWAEYAPAPLLMLLPWTPLALVGAWRSAGLAWRPGGRGGPDRLLWAWAVVPAALVSLATVRNAHYLLPALPPWSIWAALGLARLGDRLRARGAAPERLRRLGGAGLAGLCVAWAAGYALLAPRLDARGKGAEWAFYADVARHVPPDVPLVLLYDALDRDDRFDRLPYPTPFGPVPPDLAVRLYYLDRPADSVAWPFGVDGLLEFEAQRTARVLAVIARERDRPALERLGEVEPLAVGPAGRADRAFVLYRLRRAWSGADARGRIPG